MNTTRTILAWLSAAVKHRGLLIPLSVVAGLLVLLAPLPPWMLDVLLAANLALSAVILLTAISVASPLEFGALPSILLGATLLRIVLNVATTRLILTAGAGRSFDEAQWAAGQVVNAFGQMMTNASLAVGLILFVVITLVQFVIVTRGATRISEVAARFVLDALPGKQVSIDAELNSGLINEEHARQRRGRLDEEVDFYGAMDGASKFLRGDALAAAAITAINILGGLYLGSVQYHWTWSQTVGLFTRLTIGEGLVMQVPALIVSIAAAVTVTRGSRRRDLGRDVLTQLGSRPLPLAVAAAFLGVMAMTPLPKLPLLLIGGGCAGLAWRLLRRPRGEEAAQAPQPASAPASGGQNFEELLTVDPMRIELGYALVRLADSGGEGDLLSRITSLRRQVAAELGLLVPPIRIRDEMRLDSHLYVIQIRGEAVASGRLYANLLMASGGEGASVATGVSRGEGVPSASLDGRTAENPLTGVKTLWVSRDRKASAEEAGFELLSAADVLVRHLGQVIRSHAAELLGRPQVARMLEVVKTASPSLAVEASGRLTIGQIHRVLQGLLREEAPIRDLESILEALIEAPSQATQIDELTEHVRARLGRTLSRRLADESGKLHCVLLEGQLEEALGVYAGSGGDLSVPPEMAGRLTGAIGEALEGLKRRGRRPVVLCSPRVRAPLRRLLHGPLPDAAVLSYSEIDSVEVQASSTIRI